MSLGGRCQGWPVQPSYRRRWGRGSTTYRKKHKQREELYVRSWSYSNVKRLFKKPQHENVDNYRQLYRIGPRLYIGCCRDQVKILLLVKNYKQTCNTRVQTLNCAVPIYLLWRKTPRRKGSPMVVKLYAAKLQGLPYRRRKSRTNGYNCT